MSKTSNKLPPVTAGLPLLLVVFIILILVTFACLSLSTAKSDYNLSKNNAAYKTAYYQATNKAEILLNEFSNGETQKTSWTIKIDETKALKVKIKPKDKLPSDKLPGDKKSYEISCWQVISTRQPDYNQNMNLLKR